MKFFATALLFAAGSVWAADAKLLGLLMPEAHLVAGAHVDQVKASQFGQFVLSHIPAAELDRIKAETGFDPRTDLTEGVAGAVDAKQAIIVGKGTFQPARIQAFAVAHGAKLEDYKGITVIQGVAFLDGSTVVFSDKPEITKAAIDRWLAGTQFSGPLAAKATALGASAPAWGIATGLSLLQPPTEGQVPPEAQVMQNILSKIDVLSGTLNFNDGIQMQAQATANTAQDAQALADVFQFLITMMGSKNPLPATPQISVSGLTVNISTSVSQQLLDQLFKSAPQQRAATARR